MVIVCAGEGRAASMDIRELALEYARAWAARDLDAVMALHTDDTIFQVHRDNDAPAEGATAVREAFSALLTQIPDLRFERKRVYLGEANYVVEYVMSGTVDSKPFACDGVDIIAVRDGRVGRKDSYADWIAAERQAGPQ
jgi:ketosteroid isomerase-like protein